MIAFPSMLKIPAEKAGILTPDNPERYEEYAFLYPHFFVFCRMQLGQPMPRPDVHWSNARIIAMISEEDIVKITPEDIIYHGFEIGFSESYYDRDYHDIECDLDEKTSWFSRILKKIGLKK